MFHSCCRQASTLALLWFSSCSKMNLYLYNQLYITTRVEQIDDILLQQAILARHSIKKVIQIFQY